MKRTFVNRIGLLRPVDIYLIISLGLLAVYITGNCLLKGELYGHSVWHDNIFSDYFFHLTGISDRANMYGSNTNFCFPPLAYMMYWFLWGFNPWYGEVGNWQELKEYSNSILIFISYNVVLTILLVYICGQLYNSNKAKYLILMPTAIWFSFPYWGQAFERGNSVVLVSYLILLAFIWMDSDSPKKREASLILIALAAGVKIYPAILGLLFVKRKEWKKVIRLVVYGVIALFVPFIFFGGLQGFKALAECLLSRAEADRVLYCTVRGEILVLLRYFVDVTTVGWAHYVAVIGQHLFLVFSLLCFFICKTKWQEALFLCGILVSYLPSGNAYNSVYYIAPLMVFLVENDKCVTDIWGTDRTTRKNGIWLGFNLVLLSLIFSLPVFFKLVFNIGWMEAGVFFCAYTLLIVNTIAVLRSLPGACLHHKKTSQVDIS